jgi:hypothetical protein
MAYESPESEQGFQVGQNAHYPLEGSMFRVFRWIGIIPIAILVTNATLPVMDYDLYPIAFGGVSCLVNGITLCFVDRAGLLSSFPFDFPSSLWVLADMNVSLRHELSPVLILTTFCS